MAWTKEQDERLREMIDEFVKARIDEAISEAGDEHSVDWEDVEEGVADSMGDIVFMVMANHRRPGDVSVFVARGTRTQGMTRRIKMRIWDPEYVYQAPTHPCNLIPSLLVGTVIGVIVSSLVLAVM